MITSEAEAREFCHKLADAAGLERLELFASRLVEENGRQNLVSASSLAAIWQRHLADSLQLLAHVPRETPDWLDLGSGAGPPGLVIAIARPDCEVTLVESRKRRAEWLETVIDELDLPRCHVIGKRLEVIETFPAQVISARAFAPLGKLLHLSARFSTPASVWLLPKGRSAAQELESQPPAIRAMFEVKHSLTDPNAGILVGQGRPHIE